MALRHLVKKAVVLDAFPKVDDDNQSRSEKGGLLTVVLACFLIWLTLSEFSDFRKTQTQYQFLVDSSLDTSLQINLDLTIAMPCQSLLVSVFDVSGQRMHLNDNLKLIPAEFSVGTAAKYRAVQDPKYVHEIIKAASGKPYDHQVATDMGACRVYGSIQANKVAANLHITAVGHGYFSHDHLDHALMNFTHRIDELSFGKFYPSLVNPLDNSVEIADTPFELFQYLLSVVPTTYIDRSKQVLLTNQYAVTDSHKTARGSNPGQMVPGIFFKYDIEPISVTISETRPSFVHFIVRLCGIIGGSVSTVGFIYRVIQFVLTGGKEDPQLYAPVHNLMRSI